MGASFRTLSAPGAAELTGKGIYYGAAHTEALHYQDREVFVVGGANSAAQGALYLSRFARKVTVLVRGPAASASVYLVQAMVENPKIDLRVHRDLTGVQGTDRLEGIEIRNNQTGELERLSGEALFVFIGVRPQSDLVADLVMRDPKGYVYTGPDVVKAAGGRPPGWPLDRDPLLLETSVPGIFAAGDVRSQLTRQITTAVGDATTAAIAVEKYLASLKASD